MEEVPGRFPVVGDVPIEVGAGRLALPPKVAPVVGERPRLLAPIPPTVVPLGVELLVPMLGEVMLEGAAMPGAATPLNMFVSN